MASKQRKRGKSGKPGAGRGYRYRGSVASWDETQAIQRDIRAEKAEQIVGAVPAASDDWTPARIARLEWLMAEGQPLTQIALAFGLPLGEVRQAWVDRCREKARVG